MSIQQKTNWGLPGYIIKFNMMSLVKVDWEIVDGFLAVHGKPQTEMSQLAIMLALCR